MTTETKFDLHDTLITIATGYGWDLERVGELAETLEKTALVTTATVEELAKALRYQVPRCAIFGFTPADMLAEIRILFNAGIKLEVVNLVMRALFNNMESRLMTGRATILLECSGNQFGDFMPLRQIMSVLRRQFRTMPQENQINAIAASFDKSLVKEFLVFLTYDYNNEADL